MSDSPFLVTAEITEVVASSRVRLPFEPKGDSLALRAELRSALEAMSSTGVLHGLYASSDVAPCDAENVLFYNVGMSHFRRLSERAIVFERSFESHPAPAGHHHVSRYRVQAEPALLAWERDEVVATFATRPPLTGRDKPAAWWRAARDAMEIAGPSIGSDVLFGMHVRVGMRARGALVNLMKPLLDGVIAALHYDPRPDDLAVARIAAALGEQGERTAERLGRTPSALDARRLVWPFSVGVQWNPADDRCVAAIVERDDELDDWFTGSCFRLRSTAALAPQP